MKKSRILSSFLAILMALTLTAPLAMAEEAAYTPPPDPDIQAKAALLVDLKTGKVLYEKNIHDSLYPASLTKIMTALLVLEQIDGGNLTMDDNITVSSVVRNLPAGSSTAGIKEGEILTVRQLLYCLLVQSANEAADILAETVSGNVSDFVRAMNEKAAALGCEHTHFVNTHGFHDTNHYTSAWDTWLITREAMKHPAFMTLCDAPEYIIPATNMSEERHLRSTNALIDNWRIAGLKNPDVHGIKTGSTDSAGHCLVSSAQRGELNFLSVVMGAENVRENGVLNRRSFTETTRLFNWGFDNFRYATILEEGETVQEFPVSLSETDHVLGLAAARLTALMPVGLKPENLERVVAPAQEELEAPVEEGQTLGTVTLRYGDTVYGQTDLLSSGGAERSGWLAFQKNVKDLFQQRWTQIAAIAVAALAVLGIGWQLLFGRRRYRGGQPSGGHAGGYHGRSRK